MHYNCIELHSPSPCIAQGGTRSADGPRESKISVEIYACPEGRCVKEYLPTKLSIVLLSLMKLLIVESPAKQNNFEVPQRPSRTKNISSCRFRLDIFAIYQNQTKNTSILRVVSFPHYEISKGKEKSLRTLLVFPKS